VFLIRLLIAFPILGIAVYIFPRFRQGKYRAFVWGYALFAIYIFFVGLVPYLPSYGGYVRYIVGILLTVFIGHRLIRQVGAYAERKKAELGRSAGERARGIAYETAVKALASHTCPSCERDFLITQNLADKAPNYCIHCGLQLFRECGRCAQRNFAHFRFCSACGSGLSSAAV
jgi:hypothetical protein